MPKALFSFIILLSTSVSFGQTILLQEDFNAGIPTNWQVIDADGFTPHANVSQFTAGWISYESGNDTTAASSSYFADTLSPAEDYLILPRLSLLTISKLSWDARSVDASYPDSYYVLLSTTDSLTTSFTDTLLTVNGESNQWERMTVMLSDLGFANTDVYIAFRNFTTDGFILEIDNVLVEASDFASRINNDLNVFSFYPNPASDIIEISSDLPFTAQIYSLDGKLQINSDENRINVSELSSGQYIVQITTESGIQAKKLIIK